MERAARRCSLLWRCMHSFTSICHEVLVMSTSAQVHAADTCPTAGSARAAGRAIRRSAVQVSGYAQVQHQQAARLLAAAPGLVGHSLIVAGAANAHLQPRRSDHVLPNQVGCSRSSRRVPFCGRRWPPSAGNAPQPLRVLPALPDARYQAVSMNLAPGLRLLPLGNAHLRA